MSSCEYDTKDIASLILQLREKDALIAERTAERDALVAEKAMLAEEKDEIKPLPSNRGEDDEFMPQGNGRTVATFDDYVHAQKSRSQKWKSSTNDGGGGMVCAIEEMPIDGGGGRRRTAEEKRVIRELSRRGGIEGWSDILDECQLDDGDEADDPHRSQGNIAWYLPPVQRQRWKDGQTLPHVNWGDLFFDLFYVAAAYNL